MVVASMSNSHFPPVYRRGKPARRTALAEPPDHVAHGGRLDVESPLPAGVPAGKAARQDDLRDAHRRFSLYSGVVARRRSRRSNLDPKELSTARDWFAPLAMTTCR